MAAVGKELMDAILVEAENARQDGKFQVALALQSAANSVNTIMNGQSEEALLTEVRARFQRRLTASRTAPATVAAMTALTVLDDFQANR